MGKLLYERKHGGHPTPNAVLPAVRSVRAKKSPLPGSGLNLFPWRRIEETGSMMLHRRKFIQFIFQMTAINIIDEAALSTESWRARDACHPGPAHAWCRTENVLRWQLC
jgi:hypothetical protein